MNNFPKKEGATVEFKASFNEDVVETLVSFSNAKGGTVYLGVSDKGKAQGIAVGKETIPNWINEIKTKTSSQIIPDVEILTLAKKTVVALSVPEYPIKPISIRGRFFKRTGNSNQMLSADEIANEHLKTINSSWDFHIDPNHSEADLSKKKIERFTNRIRENDGIQQVKLSDVAILNKMEFLRNGKVTFGAYLLFVKDYCLISDIQVGRFKSDTTIIDSLSLNSDLFQEIDDIMAFIKRHLKVEYIITGEPQRIERFDYPLDAIREIVVNMIVHRDYRDSSASVIKIFDNRIEFFNPGKLYGGITVRDLLSGNYTPKSRNKLIARAFKEMGIIERYGSGVMRVCKICKEYGVKGPDFNEVFNGFQVIMYNEKIMTAGRAADVIENVTDVAENVTDVTENVTDVAENVTDVTENVTDATESRWSKILGLIAQDNKISLAELAASLFVTRMTIYRDIQKLKDKGLLERVGPNKNGYWKLCAKKEAHG